MTLVGLVDANGAVVAARHKLAASRAVVDVQHCVCVCVCVCVLGGEDNYDNNNNNNGDDDMTINDKFEKHEKISFLPADTWSLWTFRARSR